MSQTTFLIVAGVSLALLAASGNIDGFRARPRMPQRVLSQAELQLFTTTRATGEIVMAGSSGVIIDQGFQAVRVGTDAITFLAGSTADTEVVRVGTNGNVGIGTTNSSTNRLTVQGAARLNGTSAALELNDGNSGLTYSSSTNAFVGTGTSAKPSNGPVLFGQTDGALGVKGGGQANALYWNSTGVGIKNNAPAYALDVTGGVHATSNAIFDSKVGIGNSAPGANYALDVTGGVHATSNAVFDANVGIGNSSPAYKLDVAGGVHATANAIFDSKVGIGNAAPGADYALDVTGNVNFTGSLYQGGSLFKTSQWTTTGSDIIYTAGKIGIGVTAPTAAIHVAAGSDINLSNALVVKNTPLVDADQGLTGGSFSFAVNGTFYNSAPINGYPRTFFHNATANIGTISVANNSISLAAGSLLVFTVYAGSATGAIPTSWGVVINGSTTVGAFSQLPSVSGGEYTLTATLPAAATTIGIYLYGASSQISFGVVSVSLRSGGTTNVGVGTTNPDSPLTVVGPAASAAASSLTLAQPWKAQHVIYAQGAAYALKLGAHYTNGVGAYSSIQSTEFYSGTEHPGIISLNPLGGFVGIGITNPEGTLHVQSSIRASDRSLNGGAGVTLTTAAGAGFGSIECYNTANTAKLPLVLQGWGGFVGIGTTAPDQPLVVHGAGWGVISQSSGGPRVGLYSGAPNAAYIGTLSNHPLNFCANNSSALMTIATNGNVGIGIGTATPSHKLEVAGGIKATGGFVSWTTEFWYTADTRTWNPGDAGNWPVGGYKFLITLMGHPGLGGAAVRGTYIVYHSRWAAGNNNFGMITPIGTPQHIPSSWITDGGMAFDFNSPSAQMVYINVMAI